MATWNLQDVRPRRSERTDRIRAAMGEIDADVWVLTESHPEFAPGAGYSRPATSCTCSPDRRKGGCWVAIWTREDLAATAVPVEGEPERSAGIWIERVGTSPLAVFGTVLPWRGDTRHVEHRGGVAFRRSIQLQAGDWAAAARRGAELCVAGDLNQEHGASGPVGTRAGREALDHTLASLALTCATGEPHDPLHARGWRRSIDHILLSTRLRAVAASARVWPDIYPLPTGWPDHHGVALTISESYHP